MKENTVLPVGWQHCNKVPASTSVPTLPRLPSWAAGVPRVLPSPARRCSDLALSTGHVGALDHGHPLESLPCCVWKDADALLLFPSGAAAKAVQAGTVGASGEHSSGCILAWGLGPGT